MKPWAPARDSCTGCRLIVKTSYNTWIRSCPLRLKTLARMPSAAVRRPSLSITDRVTQLRSQARCRPRATRAQRVVGLRLLCMNVWERMSLKRDGYTSWEAALVKERCIFGRLGPWLLILGLGEGKKVMESFDSQQFSGHRIRGEGQAPCFLTNVGDGKIRVPDTLWVSSTPRTMTHIPFAFTSFAQQSVIPSPKKAHTNSSARQLSATEKHTRRSSTPFPNHPSNSIPSRRRCHLSEGLIREFRPRLPT